MADLRYAGTDLALDLDLGDLVATGAMGLGTVSGSENIRQTVLRMLLTAKGDLIMHPDIGCGIWEMVGDVMDKNWPQRAASEIKATLDKEPRIELLAVGVQPRGPQGAVRVSLRYRERGKQTTSDLVLDLNLDAVRASAR